MAAGKKRPDSSFESGFFARVRRLGKVDELKNGRKCFGREAEKRRYGLENRAPMGDRPYFGALNDFGGEKSGDHVFGPVAVRRGLGLEREADFNAFVRGKLSGCGWFHVRSLCEMN